MSRLPRPCIDCGQLTTHGTRCPTHQRTSIRMGPRWATISRQIITRDHGICHICGQPGADTADHITPRSHGGTADPHNLAAAHRACNSRKGAR